MLSEHSFGCSECNRVKNLWNVEHPNCNVIHVMLKWPDMDEYDKSIYVTLLV